MATFRVTGKDGDWYEIDGDTAEQIEKQARERIAAELRAVTFRCPTHDRRTSSSGCIRCQRYAALVGAERVVLGHESPSVKAVRETRQPQPDADRGECEGCGCCTQEGCHRFAGATCPTNGLGESACPCTED